MRKHHYIGSIYECCITYTQSLANIKNEKLILYYNNNFAFR